jgi:hypothetical protein
MFIFNCPEGLRWDSEILSCEKRFKFIEGSSRNILTTNKMVAQPVNSISSQITQKIPQSNSIQQQQMPMIQQQLQNNNVQQQSQINMIQQQQPTNQPISGLNDGFQTFQSSNFVPTTETSQSSSIVSIQPLNSKCNLISIKNSIVSIVNGIYSEINQGIFKRSDDLRLPGLVASIRNVWCISYSFTLSDLERMDQSKFNSACSNLECCILISDSNPLFDLSDSKRLWKINLLENKGQVDQNVKVECDKSMQKSKL